MILYNENGKQVSFKTNDKIGGESYGDIYKISETECLKVYKNIESVNKEVLEYIRNLHLKNYYEIYNFYNNRRGIFKAHTMKYYQDEDIDILTMPTEYTLDNLFGIQTSVDILTQNNIQIEDTHTGNIIMDNNNITIIDTDLYAFNRFHTKEQLQFKNIQKLEYLFREIYAEAIADYHSEYKDYKTMVLIRNMFKLYLQREINEIYSELSKYKYPIDYIKKKRKRI